MHFQSPEYVETSDQLIPSIYFYGFITLSFTAVFRGSGRVELNTCASSTILSLKVQFKNLSISSAPPPADAGSHLGSFLFSPRNFLSIFCSAGLVPIYSLSFCFSENACLWTLFFYFLKFLLWIHFKLTGNCKNNTKNSQVPGNFN